MINISFIKTFLAVARFGSFRLAATKVFLTQPAVSQQVRVLEKQLGVTLFERRGKKVHITAAGKAFLPYAQSILDQYEEARTRLGEMGHRYIGTIRIATIYSIGLHELQPLVRRFLQRYRKVNIRLDYRHSADIYELVLNRTVDLGLVAYPQARKGIEAHVFDQDHLVLVQSAAHPTLPKKGTTLSQLNHLNFIALSSNMPTQMAIDHFFEINRIVPNIVQAYENIETLKSAVLVGMGCGLVPKNTVTRELADRRLEIVPVKGLHLQRPLGVLHIKGKVFTRAAQTFFDMLTKKKK